jgi:hypothetical protein
MIFELSVSLPCHHTGVARRVPQPQEEMAVGGTRRSSHSPLTRRGTGTKRQATAAQARPDPGTRNSAARHRAAGHVSSF